MSSTEGFQLPAGTLWPNQESRPGSGRLSLLSVTVDGIGIGVEQSSQVGFFFILITIMALVEFDEKGYFELLKIYFRCIYDIQYMTRLLDGH